MPTIITRGAESAKAFGFAGGSAPVPNTITVFSANLDTPTAAIINAAGVVQVSGIDSVALPYYPTVAFFNSSLSTVNYSNKVGTQGYGYAPAGYTSTGLAVQSHNANTTIYNASTGATVSSNYWDTGYAYGGIPLTFQIINPATDYIYTLTQYYDLTSTYLWSHVRCQDTSGTTKWGVYYVAIGSDTVPCAIGFLPVSSRVVILVANLSVNLLEIVQFNASTGAFVSSTQINSSSTIGSLVCDSSDNIYVAYSNGGFTIAKLNTSYTAAWTYKYTNITYIYYDGMTVDPSGNIWYASADNSTNTLAILKINSSGSVLLARTLRSTAGGTQASGFGINATTTNLYVPMGQTNTVAVLPLDGSKTGTYSVGGYTITYSSITSVASSTTIGFSSAGGFSSSGAVTKTTQFPSSATTPTFTTQVI
jgi:hypothetical protein